MRLLRLDLGDVAVGVRDLRDGLLVVALRGEGVLHPLGVAAAVRPGNLRGASRFGPNGPKLEKETTDVIVRWTRVEGTARDAASAPRAS